MSVREHDAFNPFEAGEPQDAWPLIAELRAAGAVATIASDLRYVTRHAECEAVLRDATTFVNESGFKERPRSCSTPSRFRERSIWYPPSPRPSPTA